MSSTLLWLLFTFSTGGFLLMVMGQWLVRKLSRAARRARGLRAEKVQRAARAGLVDAEPLLLLMGCGVSWPVTANEITSMVPPLVLSVYRTGKSQAAEHIQSTSVSPSVWKDHIVAAAKKLIIKENGHELGSYSRMR